VRVKVDEDLPKAAAEMLRDRGYEADSVIEHLAAYALGALVRAVAVASPRGVRIRRARVQD
jgi:hypothetical protein